MHGHLPKTARSFTENARSFFGKRTVISKNTQSFFYFHRAFLNGISAGRCLQPPLEAERSATVGRWAPLAALVFSVGAQSRAIASEHTRHMLSVYSIPRHFPTTRWERAAYGDSHLQHRLTAQHVQPSWRFWTSLSWLAQTHARSPISNRRGG